MWELTFLLVSTFCIEPKQHTSNQQQPLITFFYKIRAMGFLHRINEWSYHRNIKRDISMDLQREYGKLWMHTKLAEANIANKERKTKKNMKLASGDKTYRWCIERYFQINMMILKWHKLGKLYLYNSKLSLWLYQLII